MAKHAMSELWGFTTGDDGYVTYGGKLVGYQGNEAIVQLWDAFMFVAVGSVQLTDEIKRIDRTKFREFLNAQACAEAAMENLARGMRRRYTADDWPNCPEAQNTATECSDPTNKPQ